MRTAVSGPHARAEATPSAHTVWSAAHVFFDDPNIYGEAGEAIISRAIPAWLSALRRAMPVTEWFFVRYGEQGSHVRFRFRVPVDRVEEARRMIETLVNADGGDVDGANVDTIAAESDDQRRPGSRLRWCEYEPEYSRYGGAFGVAVAERVFTLSSESALVMLTTLPAASENHRRGLALLAFMALLHAITPERAAVRELASRYATGYGSAFRAHWNARGGLAAFEQWLESQRASVGRQVESVFQSFADPHGIPALASYRRGLADAFEQLDRHRHAKQHHGASSVTAESALPSTAAIAFSYAHMMSNRLGVSIPEEVLVARLVAGTLA